ncbi:putative methyltransferase-domain-containing protein [Mycena floridula]|nr:putative methyltransferase-domain-containing protein [Mycena floridula]
MMDPAHKTKHIPLLRYTLKNDHFDLAQLDNGVSNGTALWLGAQCLSAYLVEHNSKYAKEGMRAIELGSGIGLTALTLSSLGWNVLATDIQVVVSTVLERNIAHNQDSLKGTVKVLPFDWNTLPQDWDNGLDPPFNLIVTADTVYDRTLIEPLLRTIHGLSDSKSHILVCLERRDPEVVEEMLSAAQKSWNFDIERIPHRKLSKAMQKSGISWDREDWDGIELWKLKKQDAERKGQDT